MARKRSPKREEAFQLWYESGGNRKLKDIAKELGCSPSQIRKWKNQDKWEEKLKGNVTKRKSNVTKRGAPVGNKNAVGNRGGAAPKGNRNAEKHGLFSKYIPQDTLELMGMLEDKSPADLIWDQIMIQYAAIIRAQSIMHVESKDEMIKELKKRKETENGEEIEYEFQFAWERQAQFLNAQSRAMSELRSLIKQFNELAHEDDERRLKLEQMQLTIDKTKAEIAKVNGEEEEYKDDGFIEALDGKVAEVWSDYNEEK